MPPWILFRSAAGIAVGLFPEIASFDNKGGAYVAVASANRFGVAANERVVILVGVRIVYSELAVI